MVSNLSRRAKPAALFATCKGFFSRLRNNQGFAQNLRRRIWISSSAHFSRKEKQQPLLLRAPSGRRATLCDHRWGRTRRIEAARARLPRGYVPEGETSAKPVSGAGAKRTAVGVCLAPLAAAMRLVFD